MCSLVLLLFGNYGIVVAFVALKFGAYLLLPMSDFEVQERMCACLPLSAIFLVEVVGWERQASLLLLLVLLLKKLYSVLSLRCVCSCNLCWSRSFLVGAAGLLMIGCRVGEFVGRCIVVGHRFAVPNSQRNLVSYCLVNSVFVVERRSREM